MHIVFSANFLHNIEWFAIGFVSAIVTLVSGLIFASLGFNPFPA
jgi:ATP/ADP translocase